MTAESQGKVAMITGANTGIGYEVARKLAHSSAYREIYLACRSAEKAEQAVKKLRANSPSTTFHILSMNLSDLDSVRHSLSSLNVSIDDLVLNAGGAGGKAPFAKTKDGICEIVASNVLGHAQLLNELMSRKLLRNAAVLAGSEAARGIPDFGMARPNIASFSKDEFISVINGDYFTRNYIKPPSAYAAVKLLGALWMAAVAKHNPELRLLTVSPGNTAGTEISRDYPPVIKFLMKFVLMPVVLPMRGMVHQVDEAAARMIRGLNDQSLKTGCFYAGEEGKLTGPLVDQMRFLPELANAAYSENVMAAVRSFLR